MAIGSYLLKRQIGGRGVFAKVTLDVHEASPPMRITAIESSSMATQHYVPAVMVGIEYAREQLGCENQYLPDVHVTILEVVESPADTTIMQVVYAACLAFCDAIGMQLQRTVQIDSESRNWLFPHGRG